jgi:hypothetical protein
VLSGQASAREGARRAGRGVALLKIVQRSDQVPHQAAQPAAHDRGHRTRRAAPTAR